MRRPLLKAIAVPTLVAAFMLFPLKPGTPQESAQASPVAVKRALVQKEEATRRAHTERASRTRAYRAAVSQQVADIDTAAQDIRALQEATISTKADDGSEAREVANIARRIAADVQAAAHNLHEGVTPYTAMYLLVDAQDTINEAWHHARLSHQIAHRADEEKRRAERLAAVQKRSVRGTVVPRGGMAERIARCESGMRNIKNRNSSASGYWQFIDSTWRSVTGLAPPAMAYSYEVQLAAFHKLWAGGAGAGHWSESRHCWG